MMLHPDCNYQGDPSGRCRAQFHLIAKDEGEDAYAVRLMNSGWRPMKLYEHGEPNPDMVQDFGQVSGARVKQIAGEFEAHVVWS